MNESSDTAPIRSPPPANPGADLAQLETLAPSADAPLPPGDRPVAGPGPPALRVGDYDVEGELGRGGMGVVYRARHRTLKRTVALKMILSGGHAGPGEMQRFRAEAEALARLRHPNIVQIYEVGEQDGCPYFSLEFMEGGGLDKQVAGTPQPPRLAADLVAVLAGAMHAAHQCGVVHRDLKPANVLLSFSGRSQSGASPAPLCERPLNEAVPKITDFGLAKRLDAEDGQTHSGAVMGTPSYMPPEQARGQVRELGPAVDVYALGAILYELLTGRPPFKGASAWDTIEQVCTQEPVPPRSLQPKVPRDLETICLKALRKDPGQRYASAAALADDLRRWLDGRPIQARPVPAWERAWKWTRRHPALAAVAGVSLLAAVVLLVGGLVYDAALRSAVHDAEEARADAGRALAAAEDNFYLSRVFFARQQWQANDVRGAEESLDACDPDRRRWEWYFLKRQCHLDRLTLRADPAEAGCVALSPDGRLLAAAGGDPVNSARPGLVRVWDVATGQPRLTLEGHSGLVSGVAFSPDGRRLASASKVFDFVRAFREGAAPLPRHRGEVILWDATSGRLLRRLEGFSSVAFSPDGRLLAAAGLDQGVKDRAVIRAGTVGLVGLPHGLGPLLAASTLSVARMSSVKVWDADSGEELFALRGHRGRIDRVTFSPDGKRLASTARELVRDAAGKFTNRTEVTVWDVAARRDRLSLPADAGEVNDVAFSPDGQRLATTGSDQTVRLWDEAGRLLLTLRGHGDAVDGVAFSSDGKRLASAGIDQAVKVWDAQTGRELLSLRGHAGPVHAVAFAAAGAEPAPLLASAGSDGMVKVWDLRGGQNPLALEGHTAGISCVRFSPDRARLASAGLDEHAVRLWDAVSGQPVHALRCDAYALAFSPDGRRLATAGGNAFKTDAPGELAVWDVDQGRKVFDLPGHSKFVFSAAFSRDGKYLASASADPRGNRPGELKVWDAADGKELLHLPQQSGYLHTVDFSPDGRRLALAGLGDTVEIVETLTGKGVQTLRGHAGAFAAFSPDGRSVAAGCADGTLLIWDVESGRELLTTRAHPGNILGLAYSPDGTRLATAGLDLARGKGQVKLWDTSTGKEVLALPGQMSVDFSPDGRRLAAAGSGGMLDAGVVLVWDATPLPPGAAP